MSSLRQQLPSPRAADRLTSWVTDEARQTALLIALWQGESWVLPWSQFVSARLSEAGLELTFANVLVTLSGQNLGALLNDIADFRLRCLCDLPAHYRGQPADGQPFIERIEVRPVSAEALDSPG